MIWQQIIAVLIHRAVFGILIVEPTLNIVARQCIICTLHKAAPPSCLYTSYTRMQCMAPS